MLTTTLDGLWVLQVLSGLEVLAPELGLRPHLPRIESATSALAHPAAQELRNAGVIDAVGAVDPTVREWLTVLSRRDMALLLCAQTPAGGKESDRALLARFAQWWVSLERYGSQVRLSGAGTASTEESAGGLINVQIHRLCGRMAPAAMKPVTLAVDELLRVVRETGNLRAFLADRRFDNEQIALLTLAANTQESAQASVIAIQSGIPDGPARRHISRDTVTVIDTPRGRLVADHVIRGGRSWMIVGPGTTGNIASAVLTMVRNLPAHQDWFSYRKVV